MYENNIVGPKHKAVKEGACRFLFFKEEEQYFYQCSGPGDGNQEKGNAFESNPRQTANTNIYLFDINRDQQTQIMHRQ